MEFYCVLSKFDYDNIIIIMSIFRCCRECLMDIRGCCCMECASAPRLRPLLPGHQRYKKWHFYRDMKKLHTKSAP